jgi:hypothetical protein
MNRVKQLKGNWLGSSWWRQLFHDPERLNSGFRLLSTQSRIDSRLNECEKVWHFLGAVRNYKAGISLDPVIRRERRLTPFEETSVTIYEQGRDYTVFWSSIIVLAFNVYTRAFVASAVIAGSSIFPLMIGQYACTTMLFSLQYLTISCCWQKGCSWREKTWVLDWKISNEVEKLPLSD